MDLFLLAAKRLCGVSASESVGAGVGVCESEGAGEGMKARARAGNGSGNGNAMVNAKVNAMEWNGNVRIGTVLRG